MPTTKRPKFSRTADSEFVTTLKVRVAGYFKDKEISKNGNAGMVLKSVTLILLYLTPLTLIISGVRSTG